MFCDAKRSLSCFCVCAHFPPHCSVLSGLSSSAGFLRLCLSFQLSCNSLPNIKWNDDYLLNKKFSHRTVNTEHIVWQAFASTKPFEWNFQSGNEGERVSVWKICEYNDTERNTYMLSYSLEFSHFIPVSFIQTVHFREIAGKMSCVRTSHHHLQKRLAAGCLTLFWILFNNISFAYSSIFSDTMS